MQTLGTNGSTHTSSFAAGPLSKATSITPWICRGVERYPLTASSKMAHHNFILRIQWADGATEILWIVGQLHPFVVKMNWGQCDADWNTHCDQSFKGIDSMICASKPQDPNAFHCSSIDVE